MAGQDLNMTTAEKQVRDHPATLRLYICILVPTVVIFNLYVAVSGRVLASSVLCLQLACFVVVMGVMKSGLPEFKKILAYRYIFRFQILAFGLYLVIVVGVRARMEVSFWCFLFIFLVTLWMPVKIGAFSLAVFNLGIVLPAFVPDPARFFDNGEAYIRFYIALVIFSLLSMGATRVRERYLENLSRVRAGLGESEKKYQDLYRQLAREIQHRDRIEKRLHHAIKMETLGRVAAGVAHDLNNILSGLVTYPELLLLALSRRGVAAPQPVDLCRVVGDYLTSPEHRQLMAEHEGVRVFAGYGVASAFVNGSGIHLSKTLMNLVRNGVEAVSGAGTVAVAVDKVCLEAPQPLEVQVQGERQIPPGPYVRLSVSDTGEGISAQEQEAVFEPFYTRKTMGRSGTGLGMTLALGTVNDHGGYIQMKSSPGKGTHIGIFLPAAEEGPVDSLRDSRLGTMNGHGESILVVDDEPVQLKIASSLLRHLDYRVYTCASGEKALALIRETPMDLVILDIIMEPGMNGVDACKTMLAEYPDQKVLFVTGYSDADTLARAASLSRGPCLFKPYTLEHLGDMVKARLA